MTVDLSKAKKGDKVKFRCGGEAAISVHDEGGKLYFDDYCWGNGVPYLSDGRMGRLKDTHNHWDAEQHPFDIIAIEPAPFDWSTVKAGMGFIDEQGRPWVYVGRDPFFPNEKTRFVFMRTGKNNYAELYEGLGGKVTRAPEHDIEVKQ